MEPELQVVEDVPGAVVDLFVASAPRIVLLTGGGTLRRAYEMLARASVAWDEVELFLTDERCVPGDDPRSNSRMIQDALGSRVAARFHPMDGAGCDPAAYEAVLRTRLGERPWFDLALYGIGPDAHVASLFPGRPEVGERQRWVVGVPDAGWEPFVPRLSLTLPVLSSAALGVIVVTGVEKRDAVRRVLRGDDVPARRIAPRRLILLADPAAAG